MKRFLIIVFVLFLLGVLFVGWSLFGDHSTFQAGQDHWEGLPSTATDITVYQNRNISGIFMAEFKIAESNFVSFAAEKGWRVQPISDPVDVYHARAFHERREHDQKKITDGLYFSERAGNGGGVTVAYDRKDGRGYIESSSR
jgi:hypothetical protein